MGDRRERRDPLTGNYDDNADGSQHSRTWARRKARAQRWKLFAAATSQNAEVCFVGVFGSEGEAVALAHALERRYQNAAKFWVSRIDLVTRPGAWSELKSKIALKPKRAPVSATQRIEAQARALERAKPNAAVLQAAAPKERRLAADALKNATEQRRQTERAARLEVDRRARTAVAMARGGP